MRNTTPLHVLRGRVSRDGGRERREGERCGRGAGTGRTCAAGGEGGGPLDGDGQAESQGTELDAHRGAGGSDLRDNHVRGA